MAVAEGDVAAVVAVGAAGEVGRDQRPPVAVGGGVVARPSGFSHCIPTHHGTHPPLYTRSSSTSIIRITSLERGTYRPAFWLLLLRQVPRTTDSLRL